MMDSEHNSPDLKAGETVMMIIPFKTPSHSDDLENVLLDKSPKSYGTFSQDKKSLWQESDKSRIVFQSVHDNPQDTIDEFLKNTDLEADQSLTLAAECGVFWKQFGVETVIYSCSFGGVGLATGLLMKFSKADPLFSTLLSGGLAVVANENAKVLFTSLLNPPGETIPEENKASFENIKKYAFYPLAVLFSSTVTGGALWAVGDPALGTRLAIGAVTSQMGGPVTGFAHSLIRKCYGGTIIVSPEKIEVKTAMKRYYSAEKNPKDEGRPQLAGNIRNTLTRVFAVTSAALCTWYSGLYFIETYCGAEGRQKLQNITATTGSFNGSDVSDNCYFGGGTFLLREMSIGMVKVLSLLILQPLANATFNKVFDFFYGPDEESDEESLGSIEEVSGSSSGS